MVSSVSFCCRFFLLSTIAKIIITMIITKVTAAIPPYKSVFSSSPGKRLVDTRNNCLKDTVFELISFDQVKIH